MSSKIARIRAWSDRPREDYVRDNYLALAILLVFTAGFIFGTVAL